VAVPSPSQEQPTRFATSWWLPTRQKWRRIELADGASAPSRRSKDLSKEMVKRIAFDLVAAIQSSATIDWSLKDSVRATMRSKVRRLLAKCDYPPDFEERAVELVLEQAELLASEAA
jgi:type I restriction enzyme R subunit